LRLDIHLHEFEDHVPSWGARIHYKNNKNVHVTNTCSIDYFLLALWVFFKIKHDYPRIYNLNDNISHKNDSIFKKVIDHIDVFEWDKAREVWINEILELNVAPTKNILSMFGDEFNLIIKYLNKNQVHDLIQQCDKKCINNNTVIDDNSTDIYLKKNYADANVYIYSFLRNCRQCKNQINPKIVFKNLPNFIFVNSISTNIFASEIPKELSIENNKYKLLCASVIKKSKYGDNGNHFVGVYNLNENLYIVDDLDRSVKHLPPLNSSQIIKRSNTVVDQYYKKYGTSTSMYYLI
jgi:hypothetical protein